MLMENSNWQRMSTWVTYSVNNVMVNWNLTFLIGDELTVEFVLDPDHARTTQTFKVGEPEDNTQDKDDPATNTFTKYLLLKKTSVSHFQEWKLI